MTSPEFNKRVLPLGIFVLPIVLVKGAAIMLGAPGPAASSAGTGEPQTPLTTAPFHSNAQWTPRHFLAATHAHQLSDATFGPSPFLRQTTKTVTAEPVVFEPIIETPNFELRAVISGETGSRALINDRTYGVGELVGQTTWAIESIEGFTRSVTLRDTDSGRSLTIRVHTPM